VVTQIGPQNRAGAQRNEDKETAHGGGSRFLLVSLGSVFSNIAHTMLAKAQKLNEAGKENKH
jgi:hypothetical protein